MCYYHRWFEKKNSYLSYATTVGVFKSFVSLIIMITARPMKLTGNSIYWEERRRG